MPTDNHIVLNVNAASIVIKEEKITRLRGARMQCMNVDRKPAIVIFDERGKNVFKIKVST